MAELSAHFEQVDPDVVGVLLRGKNRWAYCVNPPIENKFGNLKVIGRRWAADEGYCIDQGASGADLWWSRYGHELLARPWVHAWVTCNEPSKTSTTLGDFMSRLIDIFHANGLKAVAGNWSVGEPEPEKMREYREVMKKADYWGFHSYWVPRHWEDPTWHDWLIWRYKRLIAELAQTPKPIFFTECGCDAGTLTTFGEQGKREGWRIHYNEDRDRYVRDLRRFIDGCGPEVEAGFVFDAGPWPMWESFLVDADLAQRFTEGNTPREEDPVSPEIPLPSGPTLRVKLPNGVIRVMHIEDYVKGVVPKEVPASWPMEALKAQAIAARTYALTNTKHAVYGYDVCSTTCCQVYSDNRNLRTTQAVMETAGIVGVRRDTGRLASMFFSASCGGKFSNAWAPQYLKTGECICGVKGHNEHGHDQGLCQWGAYYYSLQGQKWQQILDRYYNLKYVADYGEGAVVHDEQAVGGHLPEFEPDGSPGFLADKCRWWYEEETRQREAGNASRADEIHYSLTKLLYRLENKLEAME